MIKLIIENMKHWRKSVGYHVYATRITRTSDGASKLLDIPAGNVRLALNRTLQRSEVYDIEQSISWAEYRALDCEGISGADLIAFVTGGSNDALRALLAQGERDGHAHLDGDQCADLLALI